MSAPYEPYKDWYVVAVFGGLLGLLLSALRRESTRQKAARSQTDTPRT
ncbi:hypothetical protein ACNPQN_32610 [Streptomyces sp. NPDC056297]